MNRNLKIINYLAIIFSFILSIKFLFLINISLINSYPFITSDGFDWRLEGFNLHQYQNDFLVKLLILRPPLFVLLNFLDFKISMLKEGFLLALFFGLLFYLKYLYLNKIVYLQTNSRSTINSIIIFVSIFLSPINFHTVYILSDHLATTLSLICIYYLFLFSKSQIKKYYIISASFALIAGLTQTYGLIPFLVGSFFIFLNRYPSNRFFYILTNILILSFFIFLIYIWRMLIPHETTPANFVLLNFSLGMTNYYLNTWVYYLFPIVPIFFISKIKNKNKYNINMYILITLITIFSSLAFFYQWADARFTAIFYFYIIIVALIISTNFKKNIILMLLFLQLFIFPSSYWAPDISKASLTIDKYWLLNYFKSTSSNRGLLDCDHKCLKENKFYIKSSNYIKSSLKNYTEIKEQVK